MANPIPFKAKFSLEQRKLEAVRILQKYPDRIPIIVERANGNNIPQIDKSKFLVPSNLLLSQFQYIIRKRIKLSADQALFLFVNNQLPPGSALISQLYHESADPDQFLYITYSGESTFGTNVPI